MIDAS